MSLEESSKTLKQIPSQDSHSDWTYEYLTMRGTKLSSRQARILIEGPKNLKDAWCLGAMYYDWKRKRGSVHS
jgi:hypothetical protein